MFRCLLECMFDDMFEFMLRVFIYAPVFYLFVCFIRTSSTTQISYALI